MKLISIENQIKEATSWLKNWKQQQKKGLILWGHVGTGKTTLAYWLAEKFKYSVIEFNASDLRDKNFLRRLKRLSLQDTFEPSLLLLEEIDTSEARLNELKSIIENTKKPIILTSNYYQKIKSVTKVCKTIYFPKPTLSDFAKLPDFDFDKLSDKANVNDFRQAIAITRGGSQGYISNPDSRKEKLLRMIRTGNYERLDMIDLYFLLDSSVHLYGFELYEWIKALDCFDRTKKSIVLEGLKPNIEDIEEFFFTKRRIESV